MSLTSTIIGSSSKLYDTSISLAASVKPYLFVTCVFFATLYLFRKQLTQGPSASSLISSKKQKIETTCKQDLDKLRQEALFKRLGSQFDSNVGIRPMAPLIIRLQPQRQVMMQQPSVYIIVLYM